MVEDRVDVAIVGGGVLGAAVTRILAASRKSVILLEAGPRMAEGVTSRNSGVIHSGLYYPPNSLKAETCVRGNVLLYEWAAKKGVAHAKTGKLVIARNESQEAALDALLANASACGARGIERIGRQAVAAREPALPPSVALWCPESGIVDPTELTRSLLIDAESNGALALTNARVTSIEPARGGGPRGQGWRLSTTRGPIEAERVVNAAGLHADEVATLAGVPKYRIHPCRGDYFNLSSPVRYRHLVYPVKDPASPGLGVHLTLDLDGRYRLGPDVTWTRQKDDVDSAPGEAKHAAFYEAAVRLLGPLEPAQLTYDSCGIRPKLRAPDESQERDFVVAEDLPGLVNLVGIESPGLTAALALAERVARLAT